jgi:hypothetical protein
MNLAHDFCCTILIIPLYFVLVFLFLSLNHYNNQLDRFFSFPIHVEFFNGLHLMTQNPILNLRIPRNPSIKLIVFFRHNVKFYIFFV